MAALELLGVLPIEVVGELDDRLGLVDIVLGKATAERLLHELSLRSRKVAGCGRLPGRAARWFRRGRREEDIRDEVLGEPARPLAIDDCANLIRKWCGARQRLLQLDGLVGVQPLLGELGVVREPLELCDERVRSAPFREGDGEKDAAVPPPTLLDLVHDGRGVDQGERLGRFGFLVEQRKEGPCGLALAGAAERERCPSTLLGLAVLGDAHQALTHRADGDSHCERDHVEMLGRCRVLERPHHVLAHLEPALGLERQSRQRVEDGQPCRR